MSDTNFFLTDEFNVFSQNMAELHALKKAKHANFAEIKEAFQKKYDEFKAEMQNLEAQAANFVADWENWKSQQKPD